jgi:hypothetical protein
MKPSTPLARNQPLNKVWWLHTTLAVTFAASTSTAMADVQWQVSVALPVAAIAVSNPAPQAFPIYAPPQQIAVQPVAPQPLPTAAPLPNIESLQAQQQNRIEWGTSVGLITPNEYNRLQQTQRYIEQQRQWAYADGWLTYDEHLNIVTLLNHTVPEIENAINNGYRQQPYGYNARYNNTMLMPPVLTVWDFLSFNQPHHRQEHGHDDVHGVSSGYGNNAQNNPTERDKPNRSGGRHFFLKP